MRTLLSAIKKGAVRAGIQNIVVDDKYEEFSEMASSFSPEIRKVTVYSSGVSSEDIVRTIEKEMQVLDLTTDILASPLPYSTHGSSIDRIDESSAATERAA
jgi:hypothetical protein